MEFKFSLSLLLGLLSISLLVNVYYFSRPFTCVTRTCPINWIGFGLRCYYFSDNETNWQNSLQNCRSLNAILTPIDSESELSFIMRYKGQGNFWFGLWDNQTNKHWQWSNGTTLLSWFRDKPTGGGPCAYLNQEKVSSALCHTEKYYICSLLL